jgi:hypothetical protein
VVESTSEALPLKGRGAFSFPQPSRSALITFPFAPGELERDGSYFGYPC